MTVVLDSWAVLRYLEDSAPAAGQVSDLLASQRPRMSWINLGEVFYVIRRLHGEDQTAETVRDLRDIVDAELPDTTRVIEAARIKADHPFAYADAFAAATAIAASAEPLDRRSGAPGRGLTLALARSPAVRPLSTRQVPDSAGLNTCPGVSVTVQHTPAARPRLSELGT